MPQLGEVRRGREIGRLHLRQAHIWHACEGCGKERWVQLIGNKPERSLCNSCAKRGERNGHWNGGQHCHNGYIYILKPEHPNANSRGYIKRAILVLEQALGRYLLSGMDSHHKNEIRDDDRPENLEELTHGEHKGLHSRGYRKVRSSLITANRGFKPYGLTRTLVL